MIDEKEDFNGSSNHEFDVKFAIDNKETKVTFKAETPEEKRSWMAVLGNFLFRGHRSYQKLGGKNLFQSL